MNPWIYVRKLCVLSQGIFVQTYLKRRPSDDGFGTGVAVLSPPPHLSLATSRIACQNRVHAYYTEEVAPTSTPIFPCGFPVPLHRSSSCDNMCIRDTEAHLTCAHTVSCWHRTVWRNAKTCFASGVLCCKRSERFNTKSVGPTP